jgi:hypothetical protein
MASSLVAGRELLVRELAEGGKMFELPKSPAHIWCYVSPPEDVLAIINSRCHIRTLAGADGRALCGTAIHVDYPSRIDFASLSLTSINCPTCVTRYKEEKQIELLENSR